MHRVILGVLVRHPDSRYCKTRLAAEIGQKEAARVYYSLACDLLTILKQLDRRVVLIGAPQNTLEEYSAVYGQYGFEITVSPFGDAGDSLFWGINEFCSPSSAVVIMVSDVVGIDEDSIDEMLCAFRQNDILIGPARDGGFYCLGSKSVISNGSLAFGKPDLFTRTVAWLGSIDHRVYLLPTRKDVDKLEDVPEKYL